MLKVIFCPEGHHVADANTLAYVDSVFWEYDFGGRMDIEVKVGNALIIDGFVLRLLEKKFPANEIELYDNDMKLQFDECYGLLAPDESKSSMDTYSKMTEQILRIAYANMQTKRRK